MIDPSHADVQAPEPHPAPQLAAAHTPPEGPALKRAVKVPPAYVAQPPMELAPGLSAEALTRLKDLYVRAQYLHDSITRTESDLDSVREALKSDIDPQAKQRFTVTEALLQLVLDDSNGELGRTNAAADVINAKAVDWISKAVAQKTPIEEFASLAARGGFSGRLTKPLDGSLTSSFGMRLDPYYGRYQLHAGADLGAGLGTPIQAAAPGIITQAGWNGGYGNYTCINHGSVQGQSMVTCYAHQSEILVQPGQSVMAGQLIGLVGSTGASTGPHLHFEVRRDGEPVDPLPYLR